VAIIAKASGNGSGTAFQPAPAGVHQAVAVDVVDMGILEVTYQGKTKKQHKVRVVWQIEELMADGKPFICQKRYTLSLNEKSTLRKDLESWRGRAFTDAELDGFDVETIIGVNCLLNVMQVQKGGETYANVTAVMPIKKTMEKMAPTNYKRVKDRTDGDQPDHDGPPPHIDEDSIPF
jgi:hypothetical protein